jgi:hypothetical protein
MLKRARLALGFIAVVCAIVGNASGISPSGPQSPAAASDAIDVQMDTGEAEAILAIIAGQPAWDQLFQSDAYKRVKQREAGGKYAFSDDDFRQFVLSSDLRNRAPALSRTLAEWKNANLADVGRRALAYLPETARVRARVYIVIKPRENSFAIDLLKNPAVFLYLDSKLSRAQFENTLAHELHHVGLGSLYAQMESACSGLPPNPRRAAGWTTSFGEGLAMLAAAGSPDVHPHADSPSDVRKRWDQDLANFEQNLGDLESFFLEILDGKLTEAEERQKASSFFGVQGPWYTVGWKMAATVEKVSGRAALLDCMTDMRRLLFRYNEIAEALNLPRWSPKLIDALQPARTGVN